MLPIAELSAAPHMPFTLRAQSQSHALAEFMELIQGATSIEVIEQDGELRFVSHAAG